MELERAYHDQMLYWQQKGMAAWMKDGDKNTSYFHIRATTRKQMNKVRGLRDEMGNWVD